MVFQALLGENLAVRTKKSPPVATTGTPDVIPVNPHCQLRREGSHYIVVVRGLPLARFAFGGRLAEGLVIVNLVVLGHATEREAAEAFGWSLRDVGRVVRTYKEGGAAAVLDLAE